MPYEWRKNIQELVDAIDTHLACLSDGSLTLDQLARRLGYSPHYTTRQFHQMVGMTFRDYLRRRRLAFAAIELRDSAAGILSIAIRHGFSSQEAFTRAFKTSFGITPGMYRRRNIPLELQIKAHTFDPYFFGLGETGMNTQQVQKVRIYSQRIPAHLFLHIRNYESNGYWDFWRRQDAIPGQDCDTICGLLDSIKGKLDAVEDVPGKFAGQIMAHLFDEHGRRAEAYGIRLPANWQGIRPPQMQLTTIDEGDYMVFEHPAFDYENIGATVIQQVTTAAQTFDYAKTAYTPDETPSRAAYLHHDPTRHYRIVRPVKQA